MGEQLFVGYDAFLEYSAGLPSGVVDIQAGRQADHDTLSYVRYDSSSPALFLQHDDFCKLRTVSHHCIPSRRQPGGPWPALNLGFNVRLLAAYDPTNVGAV